MLILVLFKIIISIYELNRLEEKYNLEYGKKKKQHLNFSFSEFFTLVIYQTEVGGAVTFTKDSIPGSLIIIIYLSDSIQNVAT
mgnify:CR=1 FL=1